MLQFWLCVDKACQTMFDTRSCCEYIQGMHVPSVQYIHIFATRYVIRCSAVLQGSHALEGGDPLWTTLFMPM